MAKAKPAPAPAPAPPLSDAIADEVRRKYGYLAGFFDHPEIGRILRDGATHGWDPARLQGELGKTAWWQTTSEAARVWTELLSRDPAEARRRIASTALNVRLLAVKLGAKLDPGRIEAIAADALRMGWSEAELNAAVAAELRWEGAAAAKGDVGATTRSIRARSRDYEVKVSEETIGEWALAVTKGTMSDDDIDGALDALARGKYPTLVGIFDKGITPRQFFDSYRSELSATMEVAPDMIDFSDPTWAPVLSTPDKDGPRVMTLSEATRYARSQPGFRTTRQANERTAAISEGILTTLGAVA